MSYVYIEDQGTGATLTTWIYCSMWMLWTAEKLGYEGYIHWSSDPGQHLQSYRDPSMFQQKANMYDWYFEQPFFRGEPPPREAIWTWQYPGWGAGVPENAPALMNQPLVEIKDYYRKRLRLNADVCVRGEALVKKYNIDFSKTIGVTWRGTDCVLDGRPMMPIEMYFPFIDDILDMAPGLRIMCTAEEEGVLAPLFARYPSAFQIEEFRSVPRGDQNNPERFSPISGYERGMQPALMVWLFSQCAYYIKNRSSCAAVASWLSTGHIVSLAHPENLGHGFDITKAEIEGRIVDLNRPVRARALRAILADVAAPAQSSPAPSPRYIQRDRIVEDASGQEHHIRYEALADSEETSHRIDRIVDLLGLDTSEALSDLCALEAIESAIRELIERSAPPATPMQERVSAVEAHQAMALVLGYNELVRRAQTLGERIYFRLARDASEEVARKLGARIERIEEGRVLVTLSEAPRVDLREQDIGLMRAAIDVHDGTPQPSPAPAPTVEIEKHLRLELCAPADEDKQ